MEDTFKESCGTNVENFDSFIANLEEVAIKENEGYPMLFCGLYFTHIVQHLGRDYRMRILPITHREDKEQNKRSDYKCYT